MLARTLKLASAVYVITFGANAAIAEPLNVVATFSILGDFAQEVGGDRIALTTLVGPNGDAHVYEPRPADATALARADVILTNGLRFEGFLDRLIEASGTAAPVVELTRGIDVLPEPTGGYHHAGDDDHGHDHQHEGDHAHGDDHDAVSGDPHAWQSAANASIYVGNVEQAFCAADPEGCEVYRANAERYQGELAALDREIREGLDAIPAEQRAVVVAHNSFGYFADAYGLAFLSPQGVSTQSEASAGDLAALVRVMRERPVLGVFAENIADTRLIRRIAEEGGSRIVGTLFTDALSPADGPAATYLDLMRHNLRTIRSGL